MFDVFCELIQKLFKNGGFLFFFVICVSKKNVSCCSFLQFFRMRSGTVLASCWVSRTDLMKSSLARLNE